MVTQHIWDSFSLILVYQMVQSSSKHGNKGSPVHEKSEADGYTRPCVKQFLTASALIVPRWKGLWTPYWHHSAFYWPLPSLDTCLINQVFIRKKCFRFWEGRTSYHCANSLAGFRGDEIYLKCIKAMVTFDLQGGQNSSRGLCPHPSPLDMILPFLMCDL